jgi:hypothetical protein
LGRPDEHGNLQNIRSGDVFTLTTKDPVTRPLPEYNLLDTICSESRSNIMPRTKTSGGKTSIDIDAVTFKSPETVEA